MLPIIAKYELQIYCRICLLFVEIAFNARVWNPRIWINWTR